MTRSADPAITPPELIRLVQEHYPSVQRKLRALVADRHAADDLTQEVFARFLLAGRRHERIDNTATYLNGVIQNVLREYIREKRAHRPLSLVQDLAAREDTPAADLSRIHQSVLDLVARLPEREREVIVARFQLRITLPELARLWKMSERSVSLLQARALKTLKELAVLHGIELEQTT